MSFIVRLRRFCHRLLSESESDPAADSTYMPNLCLTSAPALHIRRCLVASIPRYSGPIQRVKLQIGIRHASISNIATNCVTFPQGIGIPGKSQFWLEPNFMEWFIQEPLCTANTWQLMTRRHRERIWTNDKTNPNRRLAAKTLIAVRVVTLQQTYQTGQQISLYQP
jgi:hypothetical protein